MSDSAPPIGGFIGLEAPAGKVVEDPFESADVLAFWNARSAFAHLLATLGARRVWLPAYTCVEPALAAALEGREVRFYGVGGRLEVDSDRLAGDLRPGDALLGIDYFGASAAGLAALAGRAPGVTLVQDRAQALWPDPQPWGDYLLYSPRKVVGVPDGGFLVSRVGPVPPPAWAEDPGPVRLQPSRLRAEDPQGLANATWFPLYRAAEAAMTTAPVPIAEASSAVLSRLDPAPRAAQRRENAAQLLSLVGEAALFPAERLLAGAPLGVPVLTADAAAVSARMAARRVYCARHWAELPSSPALFPAEHDLAAKLLTLPCDHRYGADDMARVAETFLACR